MHSQLFYLYSHPKGLMSLCIIELWERFAFYGMRSLLILYMIYALGFSDSKAYSIYAAAIALNYSTPLIGGLLADRVLGLQRSIFIGSLLMVAGYVCLALGTMTLFYWGLAFIIVGTGLFKPTLSTMVGALYTANDARRDAGYTLFYVCINIGAFLAPLACGSLSHLYGWSYGVGLSAFGMGVSLILMVIIVQRYKGLPAIRDKRQPLDAHYKTFLTYGCLAAAVPILAALLKHPHIFDAAMPLLGFSIILIFCVLAFLLSSEERKRLSIIAVLMGFQIIFFALFEQEGCSLALFAQRYVDRTIFGVTLPTSFLQALNPAFTLLFAPLLAGLWAYLGRQGRDLNPPLKFSLALLFVSLGFGALVMGANLSSQQQFPLIWLVLAFFFHSLGEFCIAPVGMSMVSKLAPQRFSSFLMGLWFSSFSFAHYLAGVIARLIGEGERIEETLGYYVHTFKSLMLIALVAAGILALLAYKLHPFLKEHLGK